ncbi:MAG: hypothetical protein ACJAZ3_000805 [Sphingobacteriales bacterium]
MAQGPAIKKKLPEFECLIFGISAIVIKQS